MIHWQRDTYPIKTTCIECPLMLNSRYKRMSNIYAYPIYIYIYIYVVILYIHSVIIAFFSIFFIILLLLLVVLFQIFFLVSLSCVVGYHSLYHSLPLVVTCCYSLSADVWFVYVYGSDTIPVNSENLLKYLVCKTPLGD